MKLTKDTVKWLHVEASSNCNAWCPGCSRNNKGYGLSEGLNPTDLHTDVLDKVINELPNLETVQFCGNYGDPIIAKNFLDLLDVCKNRKIKRLQIHTNGSLRNKEWWANLGTELKNLHHDVWFGIDGLADTHEIYRQGTNFTKIIDNATSFIAAGGQAIWQFIPYLHNEHQIIDCIKLSKQLHFKKFHLAKLHRSSYDARHYVTGKEYKLEPPKKTFPLLRIQKDYKQVKMENCMHYSYPSIYLSASGKLSVCCYQSKNNVDSIDELFYTIQELTDNICLKSCGS